MGRQTPDVTAPIMHACRSSRSLSTNEVSEAAASLCSGRRLRDFQIFRGE
ncbi:hypothetical protein SAMCFNEI73_pC0876 (plasmid) [Sinorhizobium americanum]|uniref:Uncharacterized protein n=1 Tax=Sinorhizobium americanum TaxID=194963 RepID=A0A1L3LWY5_9HYPH|nr:hypothetical protein SAMCFNEI73_pC0876 [Sinorhizobium americanum]